MRIDDLLAQNPGWAPERPVVGFAPKLSDAELVTLAVICALLGYDNESQFVRYARAHLRPWFPYLANRDGYNKRLRRSGDMIAGVMGCLARECESWHDDVWLVDSTPVECGRSRETQKRSGLAGWAEYGYCASHSRWFWGLRLHLVATPSGLPIAFAVAGAKADERDVCADMIDAARIARPGQTLIADNRYRSAKRSKPTSTTPASPCCAPPPEPRPHVPAPDSCGPCARSSNRSSRPSKASSPSNATKHAPKPASPCASAPASSPSPPPSGTTRPTTEHAPAAHSPHTTSKPLELII